MIAATYAYARLIQVKNRPLDYPRFGFPASKQLTASHDYE
jgi:hypothetical protein